MEDFAKILDAFLVEIEKNPEQDVDDVIKNTASSLTDAESSLSPEGLSEIERSLGCIDNIIQKLTELSEYEDEGYSREEWLMDNIEKKLAKIPRLSKEHKDKILSSIYNGVKNALKKQ